MSLRTTLPALKKVERSETFNNQWYTTNMEGDILQFSNKYQVVIPKAARKTMGITDPKTQQLRVAKVTKKGIYLEKAPELEEFFGSLTGAFGTDATERLRKLRDSEWG